MGDDWPTIDRLAKLRGLCTPLVEMAELIADSDDLYRDLPFFEANELHGHSYAVRQAGRLEEGRWGVFHARSPLALFEETEGRGSKFARCFWHGNATDNPHEFCGLSAIYNTLAPDTALCAANVIDAGGSGDLFSIWLLGFGERGVHARFPLHSPLGLEIEPATTLRQKAGLCLPDWRCVVRIANIGHDPLPDIGSLLDKAMIRTFRGPDIRWAFYMGRAARHWLDVWAINEPCTRLLGRELRDSFETAYRDVPIRVSDFLPAGEDRVVWGGP